MFTVSLFRIIDKIHSALIRIRDVFWGKKYIIVKHLNGSVCKIKIMNLTLSSAYYYKTLFFLRL